MARRKYLLDLTIRASQEYFVKNERRELAMGFHEAHVAQGELGKPRLFLPELRIQVVNLHHWDHQQGKDKEQVDQMDQELPVRHYTDSKSEQWILLIFLIFLW